MKFYSISKSGSLFLASAFVFGATMSVAQARECDMPDEIAAGDSAAVRAECPDQGEMKKKPRKYQPKQDNSRYSTDGTERFDDDQPDRGDSSTGTGPKREGRY